MRRHEAVPAVAEILRRRSSKRSPGANGAVSAVELDAVSKVYGKGGSAVRTLRDVSVSLSYGTFTAVMGPSGLGKSTLLHVAAGLAIAETPVPHLPWQALAGVVTGAILLGLGTSELPTRNAL
jgi:ABC-type glutathione transport system ATPase component